MGSTVVLVSFYAVVVILKLLWVAFKFMSCCHCFDAVGWAAGRASSL